MKQIIKLILCLTLALFLCPFALAEETDLAALWEQLAAYKAELENELTAVTQDIETIQSDLEMIRNEIMLGEAEVERLAGEGKDTQSLAWYVAYLKSVLNAANDVLAKNQAKQTELNGKIAAAAQLLTQTPAADAAEKVKALLPPPKLTGKHYVQIDIADYGTITAELDADAAPITVTNFVKLVKEGFYDGLTFHRIISGFMIQGGDPKGNGTGGSAETIKGEFSLNGFENPIKHERGVLSMARSSQPDSASSQFFIMHAAAPHLDGQYAAFGRVLSGIEVVDAICANTPVTDGNGTVEKANQPVITSIKVLENAE